MIYFKDYKITVDRYNYTVFKKKGAKQWESIGFYSNLNQAIMSIHDCEVRKIMKNSIINLNNPEKAKNQKAELISRLEALNEDFMEALKCLH